MVPWACLWDILVPRVTAALTVWLCLQHGKAALHLAAENGHDQIADVLLGHKAFVNAKTKLGLTPLHLSAQNGYNHLVKLLTETHLASIDAMTLVSSGLSA